MIVSPGQSLRTVELENDWLKAALLPDVGAKIYDLIWKDRNRNLLWHNPRIAPRTYPVEGVFDNYWCGGWDDCFPTCDACEFRGEQYPNLGELRSLCWTVESQDRTAVALSTFGPISTVRAEKTVVLDAAAPALRIRHRVTNLGPLPLDFVWGTHPTFQPFGRMVLRIPGRTGIVGEASTPLFGTPGQRYAWPMLTARGLVDMSLVRGRELGAYCGHYVTDLEAGWYAVEDLDSGDGLLVRFPEKLCPYLWLWMAYGGYRGHHHVIVEPWTSYPVNLAEAVRTNTSRRLQPGETFAVELCATVYGEPETWEDALKRVS
jgi:hypothetical protein